MTNVSVQLAVALDDLMSGNTDQITKPEQLYSYETSQKVIKSIVQCWEILSAFPASIKRRCL